MSQRRGATDAGFCQQAAARPGDSRGCHRRRGVIVAAVITGLFMLADNDSPSAAPPASPSMTPSVTPQPTNKPETKPTETKSSPSASDSGGPPEVPVYPAVTVTLSPGTCGIGIDSFLDFDGPQSMVETVDTPEDVKDSFELLYRNCSGGIENYKAQAFGAGQGIASNKHDCLTAARTKGVSELARGGIKPGLVLCTITSDYQIGWAKVTKVGCPCKQGGDNSIPTIELSVTAWRQ
jgi:hypothetical protein